MNWLNVVFAVFLVYFLTYWPIYGYFEFRYFVKGLSTGLTTKLKYYYTTILELWAPVIVILLLVAFGMLSFDNLGIRLPDINYSQFHKGFVYSIILMAGLLVATILYQVIAIKFSSKYREKYYEKLSKMDLPDSFKCMFPTTRKEKHAWTLVSLSAGITEEILYRGFLIYLLGSFFPGLPLILIIVISSFIFGLGHTYQGVSGVLRTSAMGLFFSILYICIGSILPGIIVHILIDFAANNMDHGSYVNGEGAGN
ncbi:MAG: CPBP family intramembrane metalloprotease [Clostridia bacterium]|nr:CPBP family intramembrane metalloprotease [Clostridia bacterium]